MQGTYLLIIVLGTCFIVWPQESIITFTSIGLKIQLYYLNFRMKWAAWRMYRSLVKMCKEAGFPSPGPFKYVDIWNRTR